MREDHVSKPYDLRDKLLSISAPPVDDVGSKSAQYGGYEKSSLVRSRMFFLRNFRLFAIIASTNHALNYVVNSFSFALLSPFLGSVTLGLNWTLNSVSGLFISSPVVTRLGFKRAIIISFWGYTIQIASLFLAVYIPNYAWVFGVSGAIVAGFTSAIWWTAQGVCFELSCSNMLMTGGTDTDTNNIQIQRQKGKVEDLGSSVNTSAKTELYSSSSDENLAALYTKEEAMRRIRANLSAEWTLMYQGADIVIFLGTGLLPLACDVSIQGVMLGLAVVGVITSLLGELMDDLDDHGGRSQDWSEMYKVIMAVPKQFKNDLRPNLLAPFVFGFGITTAMFYSFFNNDVISDSLGVAYIGLFECFSYIVACVAAYPYAYVSKHFIDGQHYVMQFGSIAFGLSGVAVAIFSMDELSVWTTMLGIKGLYGLGRGVFEGSCRAVYAEIFGKGGNEEDLSTAFSGQTLLAGISGGVIYMSCGVLTKDSIAAITIINSIAACVLYAILTSYGDKMYQPIKWPCAGGSGGSNGENDSIEDDYYKQIRDRGTEDSTFTA